MQQQGSPVARHLRPGLSDGEIDTLAGGLPFRVSDELRAFYAWHDGVLELDRPEWAHFPGGAVLRPLNLAVDDYHALMDSATIAAIAADQETVLRSHITTIVRDPVQTSTRSVDLRALLMPFETA